MKKFILTCILILCVFITSTTSALSSNNINITAKPHRWKNPQQIYTYVPSGNRQTELMKEAFAYWTKVTNGKIRFVYVNSPQKAQLRVRFVKDASVSSNLERALGVTYYNKTKTVCNGITSCQDYMILTSIDIADNAPNGALLRKDAVFRIMIHEIGHAIGLSHNPDKMSVMYYAKGSRNQTLAKSDFDSLAKLYGWKQ